MLHQQDKSIVQAALEKKKTADSETKGCREMRPREYRTYLAVTGMKEETARDQAQEFVGEWETTVNNEASMRTLVNLLVTKTVKKLGLLVFFTYYPSCFIQRERVNENY